MRYLMLISSDQAVASGDLKYFQTYGTTVYFQHGTANPTTLWPDVVVYAS
jgi:hypothetical protein